MANQFLGLSLFIMLLSFFIILNSVSNFELTKAQPVLNSLASVFSKDVLPEDIRPPGQRANVAQSSREGDTLSQVQAFFTSTITGVDAKQNRLGTEMHMRMSFADFEKAVNEALTPPKPGEPENIDRSFLPTLVSLLGAEDTTPYRMDMVLSTAENPAELQASQPEQYKKLNAGIARIAAKLESAGMPARLISAGLEKGSADTVDLYFRRHEPFNPVVQNPSAAKDAVTNGGAR